MADHSTQLTCVGLGSCVAVVLHDSKKEIGGIAHVMLPSREEVKHPGNPAKFADSSIELMISELKRHGANPRDLKAKLYGGANMFPNIESRGMRLIGERNVEAIRSELEKHHIEIVEEEVGGTVGRSIIFDPHDGSVRVRCVRRTEAIPYGRKRE